MRVVLYAQDFEPITIIELEPWAVDYLREHRSVRLAVETPPPTSPCNGLSNYMTFGPDMRQVEIRAETIRFYGRDEHMMLFTRNEASAMLLKAAFLPGQRVALQAAERDAFARGFLSALGRIGR